MGFKFTRSRPDPHYKAVFLGTNRNVSNLAYKGWGGGYGTFSSWSNPIVRFGKLPPMSFNGAVSTDIVYFDYNSDYDPLLGDFTVEFWFYVINNSIINTGSTVCITATGKPTSPAIVSTIGKLEGKLNFSIRANINSSQYTIDYDTTEGKLHKDISTETWYHACMVRKGNKCYYFLNGKRYLEITTSATFSNPQTGGRWTWGGISFDHTEMPMTTTGLAQTYSSFTGYLQCIKVSNIARYTSDFTPAKPY